MAGHGLQVPAYSDEIEVSVPQDHVLLITFNRPKSLNAMTSVMEGDIKNVLDWFEQEPSLWVVIFTGEGRIFAAGADLKAWNQRQKSGSGSDIEHVVEDVNGFGSISRRSSCAKPMIAAVNGGAYGGAVEMILNCDLVIASDDAQFALPEVKRGVCAIQGGMPRLARIAGHQLASEMLLLGRTISAKDAATRFGFVNKVVPRSELLSTALEWAAMIVANSPDAVQSTKCALLLTNQYAAVEDVVTAHARSKENVRMYQGENIAEGLRAFSEKRNPRWRSPSKL